MFATTNVQASSFSLGSPAQGQAFTTTENPIEYNTMQNLFATGQVVFAPPGSPNVQVPGFTADLSGTGSTAKPGDLNNSFNTMQNLFATGTMGSTPVVPPAMGAPS